MLSIVSANPLIVTYSEKYNISANVSGDGTTEYIINNLTGYLVIKNSAPNDTLIDVWVAINISNNRSEPYVSYDPTPGGVFIKNSPPAYTGLPSGLTYVHIPTLPNNSYVEVIIQHNTSNVGVPVLINETYSTTKVPANRMVTWNVSIYIYRNVSALPDPNTKICVEMFKYLSNDPNYYGDPIWTFLNISNVNANQGNIYIRNAPFYPGENDCIDWDDVILNSSQNGSLNFTVTANSTYTGNSGMQVNYGFALINFYYKGTIGAKVEGVYAIGEGSVGVYKRGPEKEETTGRYILWYENTSFKNEGDNYYYNISKVNIWAVNGSNPTNLDPFDTSLLILGSNHTETPNYILPPGSVWNSSTYNFTFDGTPVIWANYTFRVVDNNITINHISVKEDHPEYYISYTIVEKIYIVGSYLIKVTKHIHANPDGTYTIYIVVENIGGEKSPLVYVYDMIPSNFTIVAGPTVYNRSMLNYSAYNNQSLNYSGTTNITNNDRYNFSIYWCLNPLNGGADGDGWYNITEINNNQTVLINYTVKGNGTFIPSDLFIVGIDPTYSLLPTTSPKMVMIGGSSGNNYEVLLAVLTGLVGTILIVRKVRR